MRQVVLSMEEDSTCIVCLIELGNEYIPCTMKEDASEPLMILPTTEQKNLFQVYGDLKFRPLNQPAQEKNDM